MSAFAETRGAPPIRGFVESIGAGQLEGWAIEPASPGLRVPVELRLDGTLLASAFAERQRDDLRRAGIGDGAHGFRFALQPDWAQRRAELQVIARAATGAAVLLPLFRAAPPAPPHPNLVQAINQLVEGQRALDARMQALAIPHQPPPPDAVERLAVLEAWVARLDERVAGLPAAPPAPPRGAEPCQVALATALALIGLGGLIGFAVLVAL